MWFSLANAQFMPPSASEIANRVDSLYWFLVIASLIACVLLLGAMTYFAIKYRRRTDKDKTPYITHNMLAEFLWSFIPLVIFLVAFAWGWIVYYDQTTPPKDALEVHVVGKQWLWQFNYKSGKQTMNEFYVPVNTPVRLIMTSTDVIHSFFLPSFRIKQDVVPGMYTQLWFEADKTGDYHIFCTEYCGTSHSEMLGRMKVVSLPEYEAWLSGEEVRAAGGEELTPVQLGEKLFNSRACAACHTVDGGVKVGPTFANLFGKSEKLADGSTVQVDENYLRESILNPNAKVVAGFAEGQMPAYQGQLSEEELTALIEFIKSLK